MNERAREIWEQAAIETLAKPNGHNTWETQLKFIDKFVELIVKECANMAEAFHHHQYDFTGDLELHEYIKKHFGVE